MAWQDFELSCRSVRSFVIQWLFIKQNPACTTYICSYSSGQARSTSYGVYISQLIRFARVSSHVDDLNTRYKVFTAKLLRQGYRYHKIRKVFSKFYRESKSMAWQDFELFCRSVRSFVIQWIFIKQNPACTTYICSYSSGQARSTSYGVYISQLIRFARVSNHVDDFNTRNKVLTAKLLRREIDITKFVRYFQNFIGGILT